MLNPDDTLGEVRKQLLRLASIDPLLGEVKLGRQFQIKFVWTADNTEFSDDYRYGDFQTLCILKIAKLVIDDLGGGLRMTSLEPVL